MSVVRSRSQDLRTVLTGSNYFFLRTPPTKATSGVHGAYNTCEDVVGNRQGVNPFLSIKNFTIKPVLNGESRDMSGTLLRAFYNHPIDLDIAVVATTSAFTNPTLLEQNAMAWSALAKSNPSAPTVSVPTFLAELKDFPTLWKEIRTIPSDLGRLYKSFQTIPRAIETWGRTLLKRVASGHLSWRWAIKPLISDLTKMFDFVDAVNKRYNMLEALSSRKSIRTRVAMGHDSHQSAKTTAILQSEVDVWTSDRQTTSTMKQWVTTQWNTTGLTRIPFDGESKLNLARQLVFGITGYEALATLWEVMPWSWFVDWFVGIGTIIQANNNTLFLVPSKSCLMRTTTSETVFTHKTGGSGWAKISSQPYAHQTRLQRWPISPTLPLAPTSLPLLDSSKWSILASLYVLSPGRRKRKGL